MLLTDVKPTLPLVPNNDIGVIRQLFNGKPVIENFAPTEPVTKDQETTPAPQQDVIKTTKQNSIYGVLLVSLLVFVSLAVDVPTRLSGDYNKYVIFAFTSGLAGLIFWILRKTI